MESEDKTIDAFRDLLSRLEPQEGIPLCRALLFMRDQDDDAYQKVKEALASMPSEMSCLFALYAMFYDEHEDEIARADADAIRIAYALGDKGGLC